MSKKETDLVAALPTDLAAFVTTTRPEGADEGILGSEGIGREDILIPRLALAQKTSPEIDPTAPRYVPGLQFTDLYHSLTHQIFGKGPLHFVILRKDKPRWVEFIPLDQGGGIADPNVLAHDPRTQFGPKDPATGKSAKPIATKFYDFIILLLNGLDLNEPLQNVMALSMKSSALKVAKQLNMFINQRGPKKIYKGVYEVSTGSDVDGNKSWAIYKVKNAGWLMADSVVEKLAAEMFEGWKDKEIVIDTETAHPDETGDTDFDPSTLEQTTDM